METRQSSALEELDVDKVAFLQQVPIFSTLAQKHLAAIAEIAHRQHYRKGQTIFYRGDPGNAMYLLIKGSVMMTIPSEEGSEVIVAAVRPGDQFGELAVLDGGARFVTAVATEPTEVLAIYRDSLLASLRAHPDAALAIAFGLCARLRHVTDLLADIAFLDLLCRLAKRLCQLAGIFQAPALETADVHVSQDALADMVGATREAVNKQLAKLRDMGLIETGRGHVRILRPLRLRALAAGKVTDFTLSA